MSELVNQVGRIMAEARQRGAIDQNTEVVLTEILKNCEKQIDGCRDQIQRLVGKIEQLKYTSAIVAQVLGSQINAVDREEQISAKQEDQEDKAEEAPVAPKPKAKQPKASKDSEAQELKAKPKRSPKKKKSQ